MKFNTCCHHYPLEKLMALLFNHIFKLGHLPQEWKTGVVDLVPKGKDNHLLNIYSPISLLPIVSKVMEKHIVSILRDAISLKCPISQNQRGVVQQTYTYSPGIRNTWMDKFTT